MFTYPQRFGGSACTRNVFIIQRLINTTTRGCISITSICEGHQYAKNLYKVRNESRFDMIDTSRLYRI